MAGFMQTLATVNSTVRTLLAFVVVSLLGAGGWYGYSTYHKADLELKAKDEELALKEKRISALETDLQVQKQKIQKLETALRLLKVDHRLARITVLDQQTNASGQTTTEVEFVEIDDQGHPIDSPKKFTINGKMVHVSCWLVKFDDSYVETAAIDRSTTLCLFKSLYGDAQKPMDGFSLDKAGTRPGVYNRGGQASDFEQQIWSDFWNIANDESKSKALGIRAAHGQSVIIEARAGKQYKILLRASDGLSIVPDGDAPKPLKPTG